MERRLLFIRQLADCMAEFLDREAIEIPDDCYSEEYSDDNDFIDDTEDVKDEEEYNELVEEIKDTLEKRFDTPIKAAYRKEIKERMEKKMEEIAEERYKNLKAYRKKKEEEENEEEQDDTHFSDEEKARKEPKSKKRPISKEVVSSDDDDDDDTGNNHQPSTSAPKKKKKKKKTNEEEEEEMELTNAEALDSKEEPAIYGDSDNDGEQDSSEEEVDVTDPEKGFGKCCLCKSELRGGAGKKNDAPWVQCPQKEVCKFTWMDYGTALEFHKIGKKIISPKFRHPFVNGRPRCKCGAIMAYKWVLNASESRAKILVGQVFAVCCVPVKEGGRCDKVIFVGKSPNKAFQLEMEKIYEAEEKEKEKKQKEAKLALKMRAREIDRDRKAGVGLYNTTLRNVKKSQEALKKRMRERAELTMKYGTKNKKKNNKKSKD